MARPDTDAASHKRDDRAASARNRLAFLARARRGVRTLSAVQIAAALSLLWVLCVLAYAIGFFGLLGDGALFTPRPAAALEVALFLLAAAAPTALFFYGALLVRKAEEIRIAAARLTSAIDAWRLSSAPRGGANAEDLADALSRAARATMAEDREALSQALARVDAAIAETQSMVGALTQRDSKARREAKTISAPHAVKDTEQPALPFAVENEAVVATAIGWDSVVRALQFPRDEADHEGFAAIREVVGDHDLAALLQAAEDILSLLSEDGLYMEDIQPEIAPLPLWRRYAEGARGKAVGEIGGVRDEVALAIARGRVRNDPVFRDTALHFLRRFDKLSERMVKELGDDPIVLEVADSRTGRAFMIVGRVMGVFD
jgi:hypothetical protein